MSENLPVRTNAVPENFCFRGFNSESWPELVSLLYVTQQSGEVFWNTGNDVPSPEDRIKPWFRFNSDGTPDRLYKWANGSWLSKHPIPPGIVVMWEGTEASIATLDDGENTALTEMTGPFWERVTELNAKFPIGPGTLPGGTVLGIGDTGGVEEHTLTIAEMPAHTHSIKARLQNFEPDTDSVIPVATSDNTTMPTESTGGGDAHTNMPPYRAIWFIRRTNRLYYRI